MMGRRCHQQQCCFLGVRRSKPSDGFHMERKHMRKNWLKEYTKGTQGIRGNNVGVHGLSSTARSHIGGGLSPWTGWTDKSTWSPTPTCKKKQENQRTRMQSGKTPLSNKSLNLFVDLYISPLWPYQRTVASGMWKGLECQVWSVKKVECWVENVVCKVWSGDCGVWNAKCKMKGVKCGV